jgi:DNA-binding MarR family transcriptional regulator
MSVAATNYVWTQSPAEGADRLVLLALADFADEAGNCFGSWGKLEEKTRLARATVARCLRRLQDRGELIMVEKGHRKLAGDGAEASIWKIPGVSAEMGLRMRPVSERDPSSVRMRPKWCQNETPTIRNIKERNKGADAPAPAISSPSLPISEKAAPKPKKAPAPKFDPASIPLPHGPGFQKWWLHFVEHRSNPIKGRRNPLTPLAAKIILGELSAVNEQQAVESIKKCIAAGWVKPFPPEPPTAPKLVTLTPQGQPKQTALERSLAEMREQFAKENAA